MARLSKAIYKHMKLYIKEFYKPAKRYFLCKEHHITLYEPYYVLYDLKNKCYLGLASGGFKGLNFKPLAKKIPYYYNEDEIKTPAFIELGIIPHDDTVYPSLYCQEKFGK